METSRPIPRFVLTRHAELTSSKSELRRRHHSGEIIRLRPGVYVEASQWRALRFDEPYRFRVMAASRKLPESTQFSHDSAAVMWGLPSLGPWSHAVHALAPRASGGRSGVGVTRHCVDEEAGDTRIDGVRVTSLARTTIDIARTGSFLRGLGMVDAALREPGAGELRHGLGVAAATKAELAELLESLGACAGSRKADRTIEFGDGRSGSLLESLSRGQMILLGLPLPELQVPFYDEDGLIGNVDFYWPDLDLIGESDGDWKYDGDASPPGRPNKEVIGAERDREIRLRRVVRGFVRWDWNIAVSRQRFAAWLRPHGLIGWNG